MGVKERLQLKNRLNGITNVLFCLCLLVVILIVLQVFVVTSLQDTVGLDGTVVAGG